MTDTITIPLATVQQALVTLEDVNPSLVCEMAHHPKKDQHGIGQKCPLEIRHLETIAAIKEALAQQPRPEQQQARVDVITVTLMREGINKHRARELADHFVNFTLPPPLPVQEQKPVGQLQECAYGRGQVLWFNKPTDKSMLYTAPPLPVQEPWGACVSGRVFVGALPEHVRKLTEDDGLPIQLLYTAPQRKLLTDDVLVPLEVLEAAANSLDSFCGNLGWGDEDLQNMDNLFAVIEKHKAAHGIKEGT